MVVCAAIYALLACSPLVVSLAAMVVVTESRYPRSLDFANERKAIMLRDQGFAWGVIAEKVSVSSMALYMRPPMRTRAHSGVHACTCAHQRADASPRAATAA